MITQAISTIQRYPKTSAVIGAAALGLAAWLEARGMHGSAAHVVGMMHDKNQMHYD